MPGQRTPYDAAYKRLFSHREMVRHLLTGFAPGGLAGELDLETLERWPDSHVSEELRRRYQDRVWRVRRRGRGQWLYVLVLLEFQASVDRTMAVRILAYTGLLYEDLLLDGARDPLPPVLPIVLYHGRKRWTAPEEVAELCAPAGELLAPYQPSQRYFLLATRDYTEASLPVGRNLVSALIRLQTSRRPDEAEAAVVALDEWLSAPQSEGLRRAFAEWIRRVLLPARSSWGEVPVLEDLREVRGMIPGQEQTWVEMAREDAAAEGRTKGRAEGRGAGSGRADTTDGGPQVRFDRGGSAHRVAGAARRSGADDGGGHVAARQRERRGARGSPGTCTRGCLERREFLHGLSPAAITVPAPRGTSPATASADLPARRA